ncbi:MAG: AzlC family ABC transporter permease [Candidatus Adiutrix sp.]
MLNKPTIKAVFPKTIPVMAGYLFMGAAFGILLDSVGYDFKWAALMSLLIYAGSMQFVAVNFFIEPIALSSVFLLTLMVNARHIFYGFSMLEKYKGMGTCKPYLIFSLTDETFTLLSTTTVPKTLGPKHYYLTLSLMNHLYWITGCTVGGLFASKLNINIEGLEFVMTALFVAIFVEQLRNPANHIPALTGLAAPGLCLMLFGPTQFIIPSMVLMVILLTFLRPVIERKLP